MFVGSSVTSIFFPIYASYKALRTSDPAQLTPWLMYWTTLSLFLGVESFLYPIISWFPFYSWIRFGAHLYLVLPGKQGSVFIYQNYIHPFLSHHEHEIDIFIADSHERAKKAGLQYLKQAIEWARVNVLGLQPRRPTPPSSRQVSYTSSLLSRFNMPSARDAFAPATGMGAGATDLLSLLGNAMQAATNPGSSRGAQVEDLAASGSLVPGHLSGEEKMEYISTRRNQLLTLLQAFDNVGASAEKYHDKSPQFTPPRPIFSATGTNLASPPPSSPRLHDMTEGDLHKSRSENEFEDLAYEHFPPSNVAKRTPPIRQPSWSKWVWGDYGEKDSAVESKKDS